MKLPKNWKQLVSALSAGLVVWVADKFKTDTATLLEVGSAMGIIGGGHLTVSKKVAKRKATK